MNFIPEALSHQLEKPEYLHVLLNPLPVYGMLMGVIALALGLAMRSRPARTLALALIFGASASAWPTYEYGEAGYDRVLAMSDHNGGLWLDEHVHRAKRVILLFYILAPLALASIFVPWKWPRSELVLCAATLALAIAALAAGGWIAYAGGRIRHREFRGGAPPGASAGSTSAVRYVYSDEKH